MSNPKKDSTTFINNRQYEIRTLKKEQLPLRLPEVEDFQPSPDGRSPLAKTDWIKIKNDNGEVIGYREADTMPNWAGSSWYYLRFTDPKNTEEFASQQNMKYWLPVDHYFGGNEHTTVHLLYSRFWHKVLYDLGHVPTQEPYGTRTNGGILLAEDGTKMSKSKGNVINPDEKITEFGADALRMYINFMGPYEATLPWQEGGLIACKRLIDGLFRLQTKVDKNLVATHKEQLCKFHQAIKKVTECFEQQRNNVAVAEIMTFNNYLKTLEVIPGHIWTSYLQIIAPLTPHIAEELWYNYFSYDEQDYTKSIHLSNWPEFDSELAKPDQVTIAVQINGKVRTEFQIDLDSEDIIVLDEALKDAEKWLTGKVLKFSKVVKNKLVSLVVE